MTPLFFQKFWHVIGQDVEASVLNILNLGGDPTMLNHTHIVLIPKVKNPTSPDFRPISLCNVITHVSAKTITNQLKRFSLVSYPPHKVLLSWVVLLLITI